MGRLLPHLTAHLLRDHASRAEAAAATHAPHGWNRTADAEINDDLPADLIPTEAGDLPVDLGNQRRLVRAVGPRTGSR